jgi:hypothetical protein
MPHVTKLNETSVHVADILSACEWKEHEIAQVFGISCSSVNLILNRRIWKHVPRFEPPERFIQLFGLLRPCRTLQELIQKTGKKIQLHPMHPYLAVSEDGCVFSETSRSTRPSFSHWSN